MRDFTLLKYKELLTEILRSNYQCLYFQQYCILNDEGKLPSRYVVIRHDVDKKAYMSLKIAKLECNLGISSSFYFRVAKQSFVPDVITNIVKMGHEVGYHYEDLNICNGDFEDACLSFENNIKRLSAYCSISTVCMHGDPKAKMNESLLWNYLDKEKFHLIGEPYHSIDFDNIFYLTDTGRRWDGYKVSVWDKVPQQEEWIKKGLIFHSTDDLIKALRKGQLPNYLIITTHPQRWTDSKGAWFKELFLQCIKNSLKRLIVCLKQNIKNE